MIAQLHSEYLFGDIVEKGFIEDLRLSEQDRVKYHNIQTNQR